MTDSIDYESYIESILSDYDCEEWNWDDDNDNWDDIFVFECNEEEVVIELSNMTDSIDYESYIESVLSDYDCEEWDWDDDNDNWDDDNDNWDDDNDNWDDDNDNWDDDNDNWDDDNDNWDDIFVFECNGEEVVIELSNMTDSTDYESYIESILSDYDCEEWD